MNLTNRSFGSITGWEFLTNTWRVFRVAPEPFMLLAAIYAVFSTGISFIPGAVSDFVNIIAFLLTTMALKMTAHKASEGQVIGIRESYGLSIKLLGPYIWTNILYFLIVFGGLILFIIPGIIWGIRYFFADYFVIIEGISGKKALSRSAALTADSIKEIVSRQIFFALVFALVVFIPLYLLIWLIELQFGQPFTTEWANVIDGLYIFGSVIWEIAWVIFIVLIFKIFRSELDEEIRI